jgi:hypothetical protein
MEKISDENSGVRLGSKAEVTATKSSFRFSPEGGLNTDKRRVRKVPFGSSRSYSITSSARASSVGRTLRPSAFAVFRFMISSYLLGD